MSCLSILWAILLVSSGCAYGGYVNDEPVVSENSVSPQFEILKDGDTEDPNYTNWFCKPRDYDNPLNSEVKYPLVIYLHGSSQSTLVNMHFYFGWEYPDGWSNDSAIEFKKEHPCFVYLPMANNNTWDVATLKKWIDIIITNNRVDTTRIYVNGFSMGGYAEVNLANAYATANPPVYFAAIVMLAAANGNINETLKSKSSFFFIYGGNASEAGAVETLYNNMKAYATNTGGMESVKENYTISYKNTNTTTATRTSYTKNEKTFLQKMVLPEKGHVISSYPYFDPDTMDWIFDQRLDTRK